jgi:hypothetical protein
MPRTRSLALSELRIGALTVTALIVGAAVIFMLSGQGGFFWQRYHLKARFAEVPGLKVGAPVRVAGIEAGSVTAIRSRAGVGSSSCSRAMQPQVSPRGGVLGSLSLLGRPGGHRRRPRAADRWGISRPADHAPLAL